MFKRFDGILGVFQSTPRVLSVEFDGFDLAILVQSRADFVFEAGGGERRPFLHVFLSPAGHGPSDFFACV